MSELTSLELLDGEHWWGGRVADGTLMPFTSGASVDLRNHGENQAAPLLVSSRGRVVHSAAPFAFDIQAKSIDFDSPVIVEVAGSTLRDAVRHAVEALRPSPRAIPPVEMFEPQWALWIELLYEPTQAKVIDYARRVLDAGYDPGVLMIDDNWSVDYGDWRFRAGQFPDPTAMCRELHDLGFQVMLWVCPYVSPDGINYLRLRDRGLLISDSSGEPVIRRWWNGYSAVLDLTNDETIAWFGGRLDELRQTHGVDGFKFDGADVDVYHPTDVTAAPTSPSDQVFRYGQFAERYEFNELRAGWDLGGRALAMRLSDANHSWDDLGLGKLVPNQLVQGLLGMPFGAPDMIGGGQYLDFDEDNIDPELFVRHAQVAALMPMMQFSAAPWRVLDETHATAVRAGAQLRQQVQDDIIALARDWATSGDPIIRPLEYEFPHQGLAGVRDCFLLGAELLAAPVLQRGATTRRVPLPAGTWVSTEGQEFTGGTTIEVPVGLETVPVFRRVT